MQVVNGELVVILLPPGLSHEENAVFSTLCFIETEALFMEHCGHFNSYPFGLIFPLCSQQKNPSLDNPVSH